MLTSSSLPTFFKCLGKLEGRMLRLGLKHSLDGLLHQTRAIWGSLLLPAPSSLSTPHPLLHCLGELLLLRLSPHLFLKKNNNTLLRILLDKVEKNYLLSGAASTEFRRLCQHRSTGYSRVAVVEVGTCAEKKNFGDRLMR